MELKQVDVNSLKAYPENARTHNDKQVAQIADSIKEFGFCAPCLVDEKGVLIAGQARVHPTQKPVALAEWAFNYYKDVKTVMDLFLGSGTTLIACEKTGRTSYAAELMPEYCDVVVTRWQNFTGKDATLETGETFKERSIAQAE
jgi:DNA modification methylase